MFHYKEMQYHLLQYVLWVITFLRVKIRQSGQMHYRILMLIIQF